MRNIFSQKNKDKIYNKSLYISKELRGQIYRLAVRYDKEYSFDPIELTIEDLSVFYPLQCYNSNYEFTETKSVQQFILATTPAYVLDFIEVFSDKVGREFQDDINMLFINDNSKYRLVNGVIVEENISYPKVKDKTLNDLIFDIEKNIQLGKFSLVLDRLHTYTSEYLIMICKKNRLQPVYDKHKHLVQNATFKLVKDYYVQKDAIKSEFSTKAITKATDLLTEYDSIRNNKSYAHPNRVLEQAEAKYVVTNICALLEFVDKIDRELEKQNNLKDYEGP